RPGRRRSDLAARSQFLLPKNLEKNSTAFLDKIGELSQCYSVRTITPPCGTGEATMSEVNHAAPRWHAFVGHALTVLALTVGGLSSFHALKAEVVELRATVHALVQTEAEHTRRGEGALNEAGRRRDLDL